MSVYTAFDQTSPIGTTQAGTAVTTSARNNDIALWYAVTMGAANGFVFSQVVGSGSATQPQYHVHTNGAVRVRATNTWGTTGGAAGNITQQVWQVSQDSGTTPDATGTWASICTQTFTYDVNFNVTATTGASSGWVWLLGLVGQLKNTIASFLAHVAGVGAAVHGLSTMATQSAAAVGITGGTVDNVAIGSTTPAPIRATTYKGVCVNLGATLTGSTNIDWSQGDYFYGTITGAGAAFTFTNLPAANSIQGVTLELTNPGVATSPWPAGVKFPGGVAPSRTASGIDIFELSCRDGSTVRLEQAVRDSR